MLTVGFTRTVLRLTFSVCNPCRKKEPVGLDFAKPWRGGFHHTEKPDGVKKMCNYRIFSSFFHRTSASNLHILPTVRNGYSEVLYLGLTTVGCIIAWFLGKWQDINRCLKVSREKFFVPSRQKMAALSCLRRKQARAFTGPRICSGGVYKGPGITFAPKDTVPMVTLDPKIRKLRTIFGPMTCKHL